MNPYSNLPEEAFWKLAVSNKSLFDIDTLWSPTFNIKPVHHVATYGSCFAQHIGNALKQRGFSWLITEQPPYGLSQENTKKYNYNVFSARTGNIYTTSLLKQWVSWAVAGVEVPKEVWIKDGRYYDPFRPRIEPNGFESEEELQSSMQQAIKCFRDSIAKSNYFVFTLGLTESWFNTKLGYEYPMCPGTVAGEYDSSSHIFVNQQFNQVLTNLRDAINMMKSINSGLKFILTVSPVPLTATADGKHVVVATMESKSILRAVAGQLARTKNFIDYFPSYEIINSPVFKGTFFEPNQREVNPYGVNFVMDSFFRCLGKKYGFPRGEVTVPIAGNDEAVVCEEELLAAFGK